MRKAYIYGAAIVLLLPALAACVVDRGREAKLTHAPYVVYQHAADNIFSPNIVVMNEALQISQWLQADTQQERDRIAWEFFDHIRQYGDTLEINKQTLWLTSGRSLEEIGCVWERIDRTSRAVVKTKQVFVGESYMWQIQYCSDTGEQQVESDFLMEAYLAKDLVDGAWISELGSFRVQSGRSSYRIATQSDDLHLIDLHVMAPLLSKGWILAAGFSESPYFVQGVAGLNYSAWPAEEADFEVSFTAINMTVSWCGIEEDWSTSVYH